MEDYIDKIKSATGFFVCSGSGMSQDSGIPVYRHVENGVVQWGPNQNYLDMNYPGLTVDDLEHFGEGTRFADHEELFWQYFFDFGRKCQHVEIPQYDLLNQIIRPHPHFIVTSNIDSLHIRSGILPIQVLECHGSLLENNKFRVQCASGCTQQVWTVFPDILPRCRICSGPARPNVLSFSDDHCVVSSFTESIARNNMLSWIQDYEEEPIVIFEIGVGSVVETVKNRSRNTWKRCKKSTLIRINPIADPSLLGEDRCFDVQLSALDFFLKIKN